MDTLLIFVATAVLVGAVLFWALESLRHRRRPSISVRGSDDDYFSKELWLTADEEGGTAHTARKRAVLLSIYGVDETGRPRDTIFSFGEITDWIQPRGVFKAGPWGGPDGDAFNVPGTRACRLRSITLYHSDAIHAFSYEYFQSGMTRTQGPWGARSYSYGSIGVQTIIFRDHLTMVEGTFGHCKSVPQVVVTSLTFRTENGTTYGPYGEETGAPFSISATNGCIVGFWGRSSRLLDAVGVYIRPCRFKANWRTLDEA